MNQGAFVVSKDDAKQIHQKDRTPLEDIDNAIKVLRDNLGRWSSEVSLDEKIFLLEQVLVSDSLFLRDNVKIANRIIA